MYFGLMPFVVKLTYLSMTGSSDQASFSRNFINIHQTHGWIATDGKGIMDVLFHMNIRASGRN